MNVKSLLHVTPKRFVLLVFVILIGGVVVGLEGYLAGNSATMTTASGAFGGPSLPVSNSGPSVGYSQGIGGGSNGTVVQQGGGILTTIMATTVTAITYASSSTASAPSTVAINSGSPQSNPPSSTAPASTQGTNRSGFIEFFSNVTVQVNSAQTALNKATAIAYTFGGYPAYSSYNNESSIAVLRIPAQNYGNALNEIEALGNLSGLQTNSNDVAIQYSDLNATLQSLYTEQTSLLRLENASNSLNSTLLLEGQIQGIDMRINEIQSQILQTRLLIDYSTISATFNVKAAAPPSLPLALKLTATPISGLNPLSVTFNTIASGGKPDYIVNYNFGDGTSNQGQSLIHTFTQAGVFNVSVTVTDASGAALVNYTIIHVTNPPTASQFSSFASYAAGLLISVVEGIVEVAVVILPIALVVGAVILPFRNRMRATKKEEVKS